MAKNYKRFGMTDSQGKNIGDMLIDVRMYEANKKSIKCPVCGKLSHGVRPEGYQHKGRKPGMETTYCKVKRGQHEQDRKTKANKQ